MKHEMNTLAIGRQEAFSTMVSNKVPATAHCLSDGIHKAKERTKEDRRGRGLWREKTQWKTPGGDGSWEETSACFGNRSLFQMNAGACDYYRVSRME